jgi:hypothetical protein
MYRAWNCHTQDIADGKTDQFAAKPIVHRALRKAVKKEGTS